MSVHIAPSGTVKEEPEAQWDDWTGGLAEPGPPRALEPAGVGQLAARRADEAGEARRPLLGRGHAARARPPRGPPRARRGEALFLPPDRAGAATPTAAR